MKVTYTKNDKVPIEMELTLLFEGFQMVSNSKERES